MREMKDSGIEWIGEIPADWNIVQVRYLFKIGRGRVIAQTELQDDGMYPVFSSQTKDNGCLGYINTYDFDVSQLTWTTDGANAGTVFLRSGKHNCTNVCGTLQPLNSEIDLTFQKYALEHIAYYHKRADTNGFKIMNNEMADIHTILPPLKIQRRIADYLDRKCGQIDAIIARQQEVIEKLKAYKLSVITEAVTKGLNPGVPMKGSGVEWIGEIPKHWQLTKIKWVADTCSGGTPPSGDLSFYDGGINWVCSYDLHEDAIKCTQRTLSEKGAEIIAGKMQKPNSILIAMYGGSGTIGNSGILSCYARTNQAVCSVYFDEKLMNPKFALYQTIFMKKYWMYYAVGSRKDPNISQDTIRNMHYIMPPMQEQEAIVEWIESRINVVECIQRKKSNVIEKLADYKKSLIYEVVTGKKEV